MKKVLFVICILCTGVAFAANEESITSREYVDAGIAAKQDTLTTTGTNTVMTYDSSQSTGLGQKAIYDPSGDYVSQQDSLVTTATVNAAVQNAINGEFMCTAWENDDPNGECLLVTIRNATQNNTLLLPNGYTPLEYIASTGQQYINTGKYATNAPEWTVTAQGVGTPEDKQVIIGYNQDWYGTYAGIWDGYFSCGGFNCSSQIPSTSKTTFTVIFSVTEENKNAVEMKIGNSTYTYNSNNQRDFRWPVALFRGFGYGGRTFIGRIFDVKAYDNSHNLVQHLIPVQYNNNIGMYDMISQRFFANVGTGTFVAGPPKTEYNVYLPTGE
ncbi:MAG: hypothetical protein J6T57_01110 [Alphaproteobacteria bacterium]|nr:hypothetical protein [Alphaproteobacteria bacterium]